MRDWMRSKPLVRAYAAAIIGYGIPLVAAVLILVLLARGSINDVDSAVAAGGGHAAKVSFTDFAKPYAVLLLMVSAGGGMLIKRMLADALMDATHELVDVTRAAAGGDLRPQVQRTLGNEYGSLQVAVAGLLEAIHSTVARIDSAAVEMRSASEEMSGTSREAGRAISEVADAIGAVSEGATHQAGLITDISDVMSEIDRRTRDAAEHAVEAQRQSTETDRLAEEGVQAAGDALSAMEHVRTQSLDSARVLTELGAKSQSIDQIIGTIAEIAQQTNMLALNAAIEAARAGEQGRGFANVADEVRSLADDAQRSADQIDALVSQIQSQTQEAVGAMEQAVGAVEEGFTTIDSNRQAFYDVGTAVENLNRRAGEVSELAAGIALGVGQVRTQIEEVAAVAQQSSASTEEVSASTEQTSAGAQDVSEAAGAVARTAASLAELAGRFRLRGMQDEGEDDRPAATERDGSSAI